MNPSYAKVIHAIVSEFYPHVGGVETNTLEVYSSLVKKGWEVTIHTSKLTSQNEEILLVDESYRGLRIKRYKTSLFGFKPNISWGSANLIAIHGWGLCNLRHFFYSSYLKVLKRKKFMLIFTPHGGFNFEAPNSFYISNIIRNIFYRVIGAPLVNYVVDGIRAVSHWEKEVLIKKRVHEGIIEVITNGIENEAYLDLELLASSETKNIAKNLKDYIIQIARIDPVKNFETPIRALSKISSNVKFLIMGPVGDYNYFNRLRMLVDELNLQKRVIFLGVKNGVDKYYLIKKAKIMVHMATSESFCNSVHEGLSQGLPCVVANNTALPFLVKEGVSGYCINPNDSDLLAEKINFLLQNYDTDELKNMQNFNKKIGKENSWQKTAERVEFFYKKLLCV